MTLQEATLIREKFYAGTSTPSEERAWLDFLRSEACPADWEIDREVLTALCEPEDVVLPDGFVQRLQRRLYNEAGWEGQPVVSAGRQKKFYQLWWAKAVGVAAIGVGIAFGLWTYEAQRPSVYRDTCRTPEEALAMMEEALSTMSENLNEEYCDELPDVPMM